KGRNAAAFAGMAILFVAAAVTPSLSFANPALTLARSLTESFTSITLADAAIIVIIQFAGAALAVFAYRRLQKT
ncbi:MAG TPA: aquaporin family protein, partial [Hyphomicrobiales bacterium]|nr:aquaporin family protein [Hyphomicrobiales bacterium]